ncbi:MAG: argininosuccinate synthase [Actinomycetes bacterium]|jgi:argininosuccinate synthase|nr:argininosuccinate synthase [Actinomycetes bacterium]
MSKGTCILAYSGGLDTSVCIKWIAENYDLDVIACAIDLGQDQDEDLGMIRDKALAIGAVESLVLDVHEEFGTDFIVPAIQTNALYENKYPLLSALSRPLISRRLVALAHQYGAQYIAHGCTGKGNDQVRFETCIAALDPELKILGPVREWNLTSREAEMDWAQERGIPVPTTKAKPYSVDDNVVGRAIECGVLEDPANEPPADVYTITQDPTRADAPDPQYVTIDFEQGVPVAIDGQPVTPYQAIVTANRLAGPHGVGRIDMVENRLIGVKSREIYEAPGIMTLIAAHKSLEELTLERETMHYKLGIEQKWAELVYYGMWYSPLKRALDAFVASTQRFVTGQVTMKLYRGTATAVSRTSPYSLYDYGLATYDASDRFNHKAAGGFMELYSLPIRVWSDSQAHLSELVDARYLAGTGAGTDADAGTHSSENTDTNAGE